MARECRIADEPGKWGLLSKRGAVFPLLLRRGLERGESLRKKMCEKETVWVASLLDEWEEISEKKRALEG